MYDREEVIDLHLPQNDQDKKVLPLLGAKETLPLFGVSLIGLATFASKLKSKKKLDAE